MLSGESYIQLTYLGPYRHHFSVYATGLESSVSHVGVERRGGEIFVENEGGSFPAMPRPTPIPSQVRDLAAALRERAGASVELAYHGLYREMTVHEVVPRGPYTDGIDREAELTRLLLEVDENVTQLRAVHRLTREGSAVCLETSSMVPCHHRAHWVRTPAGLSTGTRILPVWAEDLEAAPFQGLRSAVLRAGQEMLAERPGPALEDIQPLGPPA